MSEESQIIQVVEQLNPGTKTKEFFCYGKKGVDTVCSVCRERYRCFTDRDSVIMLSPKDLGHSDVESVDAETIANYLLKNQKIKIVRRDYHKVAQVDYGEEK